MDKVLNNLFGGGKSAETPLPSADSDFADFVEAPEPSPIPFTPVAGGATLSGSLPAATARPYTKWYNVHERHTWSEFKAEGVVLVVILVLVVTHLIGARLNRAKARRWIRAHSVPLAAEFALVGFGGVPATPAVADAAAGSDDLVQALADANAAQGDAALREKSLFEYATYATGRQNVAFVDVRLTLVKRFNPFVSVVERVLGLAFDGFTTPADVADLILYPFDGREAQLVPALPGAAELRAKDNKSAFDSFVWAVLNKESMKKIRDDRYDVSITFTKDSNKLPVWLTVMSESAEITDLLLSPELIKAVESAGELFEYLIITDQPVEKPKTLDETTPKKRMLLRYRLPSDDNYEPLLPLFSYFVGLADVLAHSAHFRPEVLRKIRAVREETVRQIQKADEDGRQEERAVEREKARRAKRDQELNALDAKAQKKYLEKEREKEMRKSMKRQTTRA